MRPVQLASIENKARLNLISDAMDSQLKKQCGSCDACCKLMAIKALQKPHFAKCKHLCKLGCSIYAQRPDTCRDYACLWLTDAVEGGKENRPDTLGVVFHPTLIDGVPHLELWETSKGASQTPAVRTLLDQLYQKGWTDYQVVPAEQIPTRSLNQQMLFRQVEGEWTFQKLVPLDYQPAAPSGLPS